GGVRITSGQPSLSLDFTTGPPLDPRITFTRASVGTYFDVAGTMQTATANTPRFDYDPVTHALRGLLIETQRINILLNSATLGTQSVAVTAQAYTLSFYGTGTVTLSGVSTAGPLVGTGAFPARVALTFTPTAGTLTLTVTGSVLNAQLEAGAFATSYIPTTAAAVTRAPDLGTMPTAPWFNATAGSAAAVITLISWSQPSGNNNCCVFTFDDGAGNRQNAIDLIAFTNAATFMQANAAVRVANVVTGSLSYTNLNLTGVPVRKMAIAWGGPTVAQAGKGG